MQGLSRIHDHHPVGQATGFGQVVRDQHHGHRHLLAQGRQFTVKGLPSRGIDGRKRFVEQQDAGQMFWLSSHRSRLRCRHDPHQRPRQRHALLLATRQLRGAALTQRIEPQAAEQGLHIGRGPTRAGGQGHIGMRRHVRKQGVLLEHQARAALLGAELQTRLCIQPVLPSHTNMALQIGRRPQTGNRTQHAGFAAARRPDQGHQLTRAAVELGFQPDQAG